jgi:hypothetical protein
VSSGTTAALSVLGADDKGETALTYTWMAMVAPGPVTFSANGTNAAKQTTATFGAAGQYTFEVSIADADMKVVTSTVNVTVNAVLTAVSVTPAAATLEPGGTFSFSSAALDQFGQPMATAPAMTWTASGGGTVSSAGVFTAGASTGGPFDVTATCGTLSAKAAVTISAAPMDQTPPVVSISSPSSGADVTGTVLVRSTATDDVAVAKVSFFVNDRAVGSTTQAPWDLELDTTQFGSGDATLVAEATDSSGNVARSAAVTVKLRNNLNKDVQGGCAVAGGFPIISLVLLALRRRRVARAIAKATSRAR